MDIWIKAIAALTSVLVQDKYYDVSIGKHNDRMQFKSMKKALIKEINKRVDRRDGKMPETYLLEFDNCKIALVSSIIDYRVTARGIMLVYQTYNVKFYESKEQA